MTVLGLKEQVCALYLHRVTPTKKTDVVEAIAPSDGCTYLSNHFHQAVIQAIDAVYRFAAIMVKAVKAEMGMGKRNTRSYDT